jgi:phospholipase C
MATGLDRLKHIVVLMMENRSFDHMLGSLKEVNPKIDGLTGAEANPDTTPAQNPVPVKPLAEFQGQLDPDPDHHFPAVDIQIFGGDKNPNRTANMQGFVKSYFNQRRDVQHSQKIMYYFTRDQLPVLTTLALEFAIFNRWFASIPGPTICNRAFAHYGTSFGRVDLNPLYINEPFKSIYQRLVAAQRTAKVYYYDTTSSTMEVANLLQNQPKLFGTYAQFLQDCKRGQLPDYSFIEPNYSDHDTDSGEEIANDQHPDHHVQAGELFIATIYNAIKQNPELWESTALLIVYDEHGGIYDHVAPPPACAPDGFAPDFQTDEDKAFDAANPGTKFDTYGFRVPMVVISPFAKKSYVSHNVYDHTSITRFIEAAFKVPALTSRDANADAMYDLFDFQSAPFMTPPNLPEATVDDARFEQCKTLYPKSGPKN